MRVVTRNPSDRSAAQNDPPTRGSEILNRGYSDPLEGKISAQLERVDQSGSPSEWEIYLWIRFDPYSGDISEYDDRKDPDHHTLLGPIKKVKERIEEPLGDFVEDYGYPEQWLAWYDSFNSQMGGIQSAINHPELTRQLYGREQSLIGALRGLEHEDSEYSDILALVLDTSSNETTK